MDIDVVSESAKILIFDNNSSSKPHKLLSFVQEHLPRARTILIIKKKAKVARYKPVPHFHIYRRESPMTLWQGFKFALRIRKLTPDALLIRKHNLNLKFMFLIFICIPAKVYLWKDHTDTKLSVSKINLWRFLIRPYNQPFFMRSLICSLLPLSLIIALLPVMFIKNYHSRKKKQFWEIFKNNIQQGPLGDSPWLWAWLQFVMLWAFTFGKPSNDKRISRVLIIRNDHIGDAVNTTPLARYLRKEYPKAKITILCDTGFFLWENCPYVDEVLLYKTNNPLFNHSKKKLVQIFQPFTFFFKLRKRKFDLVLDPVGRTETHIISYLCRGTRRISNTYYPYKLFDIDVPICHYETRLHETRQALALVKPINQITKLDCQLEFWCGPETQNKVKNILAANQIEGKKSLLGIHPGAASPLRRWPIERMAVVACKLARKYGMKTLFFEPPDNVKATSDFVAKFTDMGAKSVIIKGLDLNVLTAIIARCTLFICNDSGPMHLAAATQTPTVAIFGPGEYWRWQPLHPTSQIVRKSISCSPCSENDCKEPQCILQIDIPDVLSAAESVLATAQLIT